MSGLLADERQNFAYRREVQILRLGVPPLPRASGDAGPGRSGNAVIRHLGGQ
jgi:hypothetical protein